jgi:hypothetical protein
MRSRSSDVSGGGEMSDSNTNILKQPSLNRTFELVHLQQSTGKEAGRYKARREEREKNTDFLRFVLEELEGMQQKVGELRFAIAAMTTLVKDKLEHS